MEGKNVTIQQVTAQPDMFAEQKVQRVENPESYLKLYGRWMEKCSEQPLETRRATSYNNVVVAWLNQHMPSTGAEKCAHCGKTTGLVAVTKDCWVHNHCHETWRHTRRLRACEALREMGITPLGVQGDWDDEEAAE